MNADINPANGGPALPAAGSLERRVASVALVALVTTASEAFFLIAALQSFAPSP